MKFKWDVICNISKATKCNIFKKTVNFTLRICWFHISYHPNRSWNGIYRITRQENKMNSEIRLYVLLTMSSTLFGLPSTLFGPLLTFFEPLSTLVGLPLTLCVLPLTLFGPPLTLLGPPLILLGPLSSTRTEERQVNIEVNDQWLFTVNKYVDCSCGYLSMFTGSTHLVNVSLIAFFHLLRKTFCFELRFLGPQSLNFVSKPGNRFVLQHCAITANRNKMWPLSTL